MSLSSKPSEIEIKRYNHWVNFDVLPQLVLSYNENQLSINEFNNIIHFSDGSELYEKLKTQMSFNVISNSDQPDFVFIMVSTPSNEQICEVALACVAVNKILHNALLMTMEYTFNSTFVICEPTTTKHSNFGVFVDDNEQFNESAYNLALERWHKMASNRKSNEEDARIESCEENDSISISIPQNYIEILKDALVDMMDNLEQKAGSKTTPPIAIKKDEIIQSWPLLDFYHAHGRMSVISCVNESDGSKYKSCKFCDSNDNILFVSFSKTLGELTAKEIAARKKELLIVLTEQELVLCSSEEIA